MIGASYHTFESEARELTDDDEGFLDSPAHKKERHFGGSASRGSRDRDGKHEGNHAAELKYPNDSQAKAGPRGCAQLKSTPESYVR